MSYPPAAKSGPVETLHGVRVANPYRWLEALGSGETRAWLDAEGALTRRWFEGVPGRAGLERQLAAALSFEFERPPTKAGARWFFVRKGQLEQPVVDVAEGPAGARRPVVDFNQVSPDGKLGFAGYVPSPRGTYVAYGLARGGSDWVQWRVREVATGRDLPDRVEWTKYYRPAWAADEKGFYYSAFPKPPEGKELTAEDLGCRVRQHRLGADVASDPVVYERPDRPTWQFVPDATDDGRYLVVTTGDGQVGDRGVEDVHVVDLAAKGGKVTPIVEEFDAEYQYVTSQGPTLYFKTTNGAPNGRLIAVDVRRPARAARARRTTSLRASRRPRRPTATTSPRAGPSRCAGPRPGSTRAGSRRARCFTPPRTARGYPCSWCTRRGSRSTARTRRT